jgi:hypothetical protein
MGRLKLLSRKHDMVYPDYDSALADERQGLEAELSPSEGEP